MLISPHQCVGATLAVICCAVGWSAHAQVYKCKDSSGRTVYSGKPCEYEGKPLDLSDNVIEAERPAANAYAPSTSSAGPTGASAECARMQREMQEQASKTAPSGIVDGYNERGKFNRLAKAYEFACLGGTTADQTKPRKKANTNSEPVVGQPSTMCADGSFVPGTSGCQYAPNGKFVQGGGRVTLCPDGSYVGGSECVMGPNGKFTGRN